MVQNQRPDTEKSQQIDTIVDYVVATGTEKTATGYWVINIRNIPLEIAYPDFIKENREAILDALWERDAVMEADIDEYTFDMEFGLDYCPYLESQWGFEEEMGGFTDE